MRVDQPGYRSRTRGFARANSPPLQGFDLGWSKCDLHARSIRVRVSRLPPASQTAKTMLLLLSLVASCATLSAATSDFDTRFTGRTLRFDYHHSGNAGEEHIAPDRFRLEGAWAGSRTQLVDETNLGKYLFLVIDPETNRTIYSRGFASIYGEWETTREARSTRRVFHESQRFPEPRKPVQVVLKKRALDGTFREIHSSRVDPNSRFVDRSKITPAGEVMTILEGGPPQTSVDLLLVGDGYTAEQRGKFVADVQRLVDSFFDWEPYRSRKSDFNVRALHVPSEESGISNPRQGVWRDNPLGLSFNAFDSDRYVLTYANRALREAAASAPYDAVVFVFNDRKYGGGGIFNLWCTTAADSSQAAYLFVHEFGHSFAGLADEYYTSQVSYEEFNPPGYEPWEPNVTALLDPLNVKWKDLVEGSVPLPTPWNQAAYDKASYDYQARRQELRSQGAGEETMEALFNEVKSITKPMLEGEEHYGHTGAFEGAAYEAKGLYRSEVDCIMFTRNPTKYCCVCTRAIERIIDLYSK